MNRQNLTIIWGYLVEPILASLLIVLACILFGTSIIATLMRQVAVDLATLYCAVFFAAALGFLWTLFSAADTPFYRWLDEVDSFSVYLQATAYTVAIGAISTLVLGILKLFENQALAITASFFFLMAVINTYTLIANVFGLIKLNALYNRIHRPSIL